MDNRLSELRVQYASREQQFASEASSLSRRINNISNLRLVLAVAFVAVGYFAFQASYLFFFLPLIALWFGILVREHNALFVRRKHAEHLASINRHELQSLDHNFNAFEDGAAFIEPRHQFSYDLDIFGPGSLYQRVSRCNTRGGKQKLASKLTSVIKEKSEILETQSAVNELSSRLDFRQNYQAAGKEMDESAYDQEELKSWTKLPPFISNKRGIKILLTAVPVVTIIAVIAAFIDNTFRPIALLLAGFQWSYLGMHMKRVNLFHDYVSKKRATLEKYATLLHYINQERFSTPILSSYHARAADADKQIRELAALVQSLDARLNSMTMLVMNSLLMWDLRCVYRLERWKEQNATQLLAWMDIVAEIDAMNSFGNFSYNNPHFTFPEIADTLAIRARDMGHPLIPANECVVNNLAIGNGPSVLIVTGANMAGKSTFLRTIGVNIILALNGLPVSAAEFSCPLTDLRTGMRTADSLKDHQSYFYAELDRLKIIMDELRQDRPLLILLDEILKGTNSTDKQTGSISLVKQLLPHPCLAIIATHDIVLGELEKTYPEKIRNYHFEANIENDQLSFDYKLKEGVAEKMNATFLMKKMGIIPA